MSYVPYKIQNQFRWIKNKCYPPYHKGFYSFPYSLICTHCGGGGVLGN